MTPQQAARAAQRRETFRALHERRARGGPADFARVLLPVIGAVVTGGIVTVLAEIDFGGVGNILPLYMIGTAIYFAFFLLPTGWIQYHYFNSPMRRDGPDVREAHDRLPARTTGITMAGPKVQYSDPAEAPRSSDASFADTPTSAPPLT